MAKIKFEKQSDFFQQVYQVVRLIPKGKVTSYGAIAKYLGSAKSSRLVGYAMNNSHVQIPPVPAHRVVNRNGVLTGKHFFANENEMQNLLENEGIKVANDAIVHFKECFWDPSQALNIA
ncbi:MAG TPA: MGMT family protein [Bacteroidia bacterium]|nr:MGMT family protein [Bacteroidia bacterium]